MMQQHFPSITVGVLAGMSSLAVPDGISSFFEKLLLGCLIALITGFVHGFAKRLGAGKKV